MPDEGHPFYIRVVQWGRRTFVKGIVSYPVRWDPAGRGLWTSGYAHVKTSFSLPALRWLQLTNPLATWGLSLVLVCHSLGAPTTADGYYLLYQSGTISSKESSRHALLLIKDTHGPDTKGLTQHGKGDIQHSETESSSSSLSALARYMLATTHPCFGCLLWCGPYFQGPQARSQQ